MHQARSKLESHVADWRAAGLIKESLIKPVIATIEKQFVIKKLGALAAADKAMLVELLSKVLGDR